MATSSERTVAERIIEGPWRLKRKRDVEPLVELHADDREVGNVASPRRFNGKERARDFWRRYRAAFDDVESRFHGILIDGAGAALEWTAEGAPFRYDGELWFVTYAGTPKVDEIRREHQVNVSYSKPDDNAWVSVSGPAALVRDRSKIEELWLPLLKAWFPEGKEDPRLALPRVDVEHDGPHPRLHQVTRLRPGVPDGRE